ncbi:MAG: FAD binding domain-containing protein [Candidatus Neomarinimicrobiota bacterium]
MLYFCPQNLNELGKCLEDQDSAAAAYLAGGTDIMPPVFDDLKPLPQALIDLKKIDDFKGIRVNNQEIIIGALTTVEEILNSDLIRLYFKSLTGAARDFAGVQIRNRATIGGNICNASPAGDLLPGLYTYDAMIKVWSPDAEYIIPIREFILGPGKTSLRSNEIVASISLKKRKISSIFFKLGLRRAMAISVVNFAIAYKMGPDGLFEHLKIAAGSVGPKIADLEHFSKAVLAGKNPHEVIDLVDRDINPINDIRGSASYRRIVLKNTILETLEKLYV